MLLFCSCKLSGEADVWKDGGEGLWWWCPSSNVYVICWVHIHQIKDKAPSYLQDHSYPPWGDGVWLTPVYVVMTINNLWFGSVTMDEICAVGHRASTVQHEVYSAKIPKSIGCFFGIVSVWKSGLVWFFDAQGNHNHNRLFPRSQKTRPDRKKTTDCGFLWSLDQFQSSSVLTGLWPVFRPIF